MWTTCPRLLRGIVPAGIEPTTYWSQVQRHTTTPLRHMTVGDSLNVWQDAQKRNLNVDASMPTGAAGLYELCNNNNALGDFRHICPTSILRKHWACSSYSTLEELTTECVNCASITAVVSSITCETRRQTHAVSTSPWALLTTSNLRCYNKDHENSF